MQLTLLKRFKRNKAINCAEFQLNAFEMFECFGNLRFLQSKRCLLRGLNPHQTSQNHRRPPGPWCENVPEIRRTKNIKKHSLHLITSHYPNENSSLCHHCQLVQLVLCWSFSFTCTHCAECSHASREPWKQKTNTRTYLYCMCMHIFIYKVIIHIYNIYIYNIYNIYIYQSNMYCMLKVGHTAVCSMWRCDRMPVPAGVSCQSRKSQRGLGLHTS